MVDAVIHERGSCPPPTPARGPAPTTTRLQPKITEFFAVTNQSTKPVPVTRVSFLNLPSHIRNRIYSEAGFGDNHFIDLNFWTIKHLDERWHDEDGQQINPDYGLGEDRALDKDSSYNKELFPVTLLRAGSRLIHDEVQTKLYAENTFAVSLEGSQGLWALEKLSDAALRELRVLVVGILPCRCITPYCSELDRHHQNLFRHRPSRQDYWDSVQYLIGGHPHNRPLGCISRTDKSILSQWDRICARLAANSRPRQLSLYLVANVADEQTARGILNSLYRMSALEDCAINLGFNLEEFDNVDPNLVVRQAVKKLTNHTQEQPFRFLDLPLELQIRILQETSLVPNIPVRWTRNGNFDPRNFQRTCWEKEDFARSGCDYDGEALPPGFLTKINPSVFCTLMNLSAFSHMCECRESPIEYFQVSKAFSVAARHVFYARNTFHIYPAFNDLGVIVGNWGHGYQLTLPSFLSSIPREHISSLRNLCIIFPPFLHDYLLPDQPEWNQWVVSIDHLAQLADLSRLKLEVHFSEQNPLPGSYVQDEEDRLNIIYSRARERRDSKAERDMLDSYVRILDPLRKLGSNLCALQVYVSWPLGEAAHDQRKTDEKLLEKMIMGEDYDSGNWGKSEKSSYSQPVQWRHDY